MSHEEIPPKSWYKRPWVWVLVALVAAWLVVQYNLFPAGRYECTWSGGTGPDGEIAGDLVVTVGQWPNTYPLKARIYTATGPVNIIDWTHSHDYFEKEFLAVIPIDGVDHQALCELR